MQPSRRTSQAIGPSAERVSTRAVNLNHSHTIATEAAPPTADTPRTRANFLMYQGKRVKERRPHRIHATHRELLDLTFEADEESETQRGARLGAQRQLVPQPPRSCSRQTGAIVYRGYDEGKNPFKPKDARAVGKNAKADLSNDDIQRQLQEMHESVRGRRPSAPKFLDTARLEASMNGSTNPAADDVGPIVGLPSPGSSERSPMGSRSRGRTPREPPSMGAARKLASVSPRAAAVADREAFGDFQAEIDDGGSPLGSPPAPSSPLLKALHKSAKGRQVVFDALDEAPRAHAAPGSSVPRLPVIPSALARQPTVYRIATRTAREERDRRNPTLQHTPSKVMEQQVMQRRRTMLAKHSMLLRNGGLVESRKVDDLVRTVMALNALDPAAASARMAEEDAKHRRGGGGGTKSPKAKKQKGYMQSIGHIRNQQAGADASGDDDLEASSSRNFVMDDDDRYGFSVETVKHLKQVFDKLQVEHAFLSCLSVGAPIVVESAVITQPQLTKCLDAELEVQFQPFARLLRPEVPDHHFSDVMARWRKYRAELKENHVTFRERLDLATVKDIERIWAGVFDNFGNKTGDDRLVACTDPHEPGLTLQEFTLYVTRMNSVLSAEDARASFTLHCTPGGYARVLQAEEKKQRDLRQLRGPARAEDVGKGARGTAVASAARTTMRRTKSIAFAAPDSAETGKWQATGPGADEQPSLARSRSGTGSFGDLRRTSSTASAHSNSVEGGAAAAAPGPQCSPAVKQPATARPASLERTGSIARKPTMGNLTKGHGALARHRTRRLDPKGSSSAAALSERRPSSPLEPVVLAEVEPILTIEGFANTVAVGSRSGGI